MTSSCHGKRTIWWSAGLSLSFGAVFTNCTCDETLATHIDGGLSTAEAGAGRCSLDLDCASGFCDVGTCATPTPIERTTGADVWFGRQCSPSQIGPSGIKSDSAFSCGGYLCLEGRCRSCESGLQCYEAIGVLGCYASRRTPGRLCGEIPDRSGDAIDIYKPVEASIATGRALEPVPQESGIPSGMSFAVEPVPRAGARLAVLWWHQRSGEFDEFMRVAYDVALAEDATEVVIPFAALTMPTSENLICFRACRDRSQCDCQGLPQAALGSVLVAEDLDQDGALSFDELRREQIGGGRGLIGWAPVRQNSTPIDFGIFEGPILAGFAGYSSDSGLLSAVSETDAGAAPLSLAICPPGDSTCTFPVFHLLCNRDCNRDWGLNRFGL